MKKILSGLTVAAALIPAFVSAATVEELTAQIQALLQQVTTLQQQVGGTTQTGAVQTTAATTGTSLQCPLISRNLKKGMSGTDVTRLQQFLALDPSIYPEMQVTGFYGALTEAAVKKFQCKYNIVCDGAPETTGYGVVGPRTAALMALQCPGGSVSTPSASAPASGFIRVTPTAGAAPLNVTIEAIVNTAKSCTAATYEVNFGNGQTPTVIQVPAGVCNEIRQLMNVTYSAAGTYSVTLRSGVHQSGTTITVTGSGTTSSTSGTNDSFTATPTSGNAPLNVTFNGTLNAIGACNAGPFRLRFGDGTSVDITDAGCRPTTFNVTHAYTTTGSFVAKLGKGVNLDTVSSLAISVGGTSGGNFSVTPGTDGSPLKVTAQFDLSKECARYDLDWGDGTTHAAQGEGSCSGSTASKSVVHTYANPGTYTITLARGSSLEQTATVALTIAQ